MSIQFVLSLFEGVPDLVSAIVRIKVCEQYKVRQPRLVISRIGLLLSNFLLREFFMEEYVTLLELKLLNRA